MTTTVSLRAVRSFSSIVKVAMLSTVVLALVLPSRKRVIFQLRTDIGESNLSRQKFYPQINFQGNKKQYSRIVQTICISHVLLPACRGRKVRGCCLP